MAKAKKHFRIFLEFIFRGGVQRNYRPALGVSVVTAGKSTGWLLPATSPGEQERKDVQCALLAS
jgi:hypothetical protein